MIEKGKNYFRIFKVFEQNIDFANECIPDLLNSKNDLVRCQAAAYCMALKIKIDLAEIVLEEICSNPKNGILGFNAEMTLKVWREKGELQLYQKKR